MSQWVPAILCRDVETPLSRLGVDTGWRGLRSGSGGCPVPPCVRCPCAVSCMWGFIESMLPLSDVTAVELRPDHLVGLFE